MGVKVCLKKTLSKWSIVVVFQGGAIYGLNVTIINRNRTFLAINGGSLVAAVLSLASIEQKIWLANAALISLLVLSSFCSLKSLKDIAEGVKVAWRVVTKDHLTKDHFHALLAVTLRDGSRRKSTMKKNKVNPFARTFVENIQAPE